MLSIIILVLASAMYSFTTTLGHAEGIFNALNTSTLKTNRYIWDSLGGTSSISISVNAAISKIPESNRVSAIRELGNYLKSYLLSAEFLCNYNKLREEKKPVVPLSIQERIDRQIADQNSLLKDAQESLRNASVELKPVFQAIVKKYKQSVTALENDYDPQHQKEIESILVQYDYDMGDYKFRMKQFEKVYPTDVRAFIRIRLQEFLRISTTVDFNAKTREIAGETTFIEGGYESKPAAWKFCYYAGKDATAAAREFVSKWLTEI